MLKRKIFDYGGAQAILTTKGLLEQLERVLDKAISVDHEEVLRLLSESGWQREKLVASGVTQRWDAYKERIAVTVEFSLIDAIQRDFLRALWWKHLAKMDALVCIVPMAKEPTFSSVVNNIQVFSAILTFPILVVGVESS